MKKKGPTPGVPSAEEGGGKQDAGGQAWAATSFALLAAAVFAADLWLPPDIAGSVAYVAPLLLGWRFAGRRFIVLYGGVATLLTVAGFLLSPAAGMAWVALTNRGFALFAIWITVIMLIRAKGALELRVASHTAELREIRATLARAERLGEMGRLSGTVAHELRNPLGVIATSIAVIEARSRDARLDLEAALSRAHRSIKRCESIITEHLDFARAKGHRPEPAILDDWLSGVLHEMPLSEKVTLDRDLGAGGATVHIDPESLRRALINLIDNACQAMTARRGGADTAAVHRLAVTSRIEGGCLEITVSDNGPGISPDILARITEPLFSTRVSGTGLGLPVVRRIMDDHGGSLRIDSTPGQGTQVILGLPHGGRD
jgi:signal transduction histidine kinase